MSAFPFNADLKRPSCECPLLTHSGHSVAGLFAFVIRPRFGVDWLIGLAPKDEPRVSVGDAPALVLMHEVCLGALNAVLSLTVKAKR